MITIKEAIICEGKYDKIKLSQIFDTLIITTDGFRIYKDKTKMAMIKKIANTRGIIILTDSDTAGIRIRNRIFQSLGKNDNIKNVYLPEIKGKEKRKKTFGAEGILGVEGTDDRIIIEAVMKQAQINNSHREKLTKADFYELGIIGSGNSSEMRTKIAKILGLPSKISANSMLDTINILYSKEEFYELLENISNI